LQTKSLTTIFQEITEPNWGEIFNGLKRKNDEKGFGVRGWLIFLYNGLNEECGVAEKWKIKMIQTYMEIINIILLCINYYYYFFL
jgi:hypothetical protein